MYPSYLKLYKEGKLSRIAEDTFRLLESCAICPRRCNVNRLDNQKGFCRTGLRAKVCSFLPHQGEEPPISGRNGSGTIFFSNCSMTCLYCQNYRFSQLEEGREVELKELADFMLQLQDLNCHNINFVTPTHVMPQILKALTIAIPRGFRLPIVYNTSGYELAQSLRILEGIVDIYLPDMRYAHNKPAIAYSNAPDYPKYNQQALKEMYRQVGAARFNRQGLIEKGVIIRHLVLPDNISGTDRIMEFIAEQLSKDAYISLMSQYSPYFRALDLPNINRRIAYEEYEQARQSMEKHGLSNGWTQESHGLARFAGINIKPV